MFWFLGVGYLLSAVGFYIWMVKRAVYHEDATVVELSDDSYDANKDEQSGEDSLAA